MDKKKNVINKSIKIDFDKDCKGSNTSKLIKKQLKNKEKKKE